MRRSFILCIVMLAAAGVWAQEPSGATTDSGTVADDSSQMQAPPPMSGEAYPAEGSGEARTNFLSGGLMFAAAYDDNVVGGGTSTPVSATSYTIHPTFTLNQSTSRQQRMITYSPGFTFYEPVSALNEADQMVSGGYHYRMSPHLTFGASESFSRSSNVFNQGNFIAGGAVTGAPQPVAVIAPFAGQQSNGTNGDVTYQMSANGMIGGTGSYSRQSYTNPNQATGLFNSNSVGGSFSYSSRVSSTQYLGARYQFLRSVTDSTSLETETQGHTIAPFYTVLVKHTFSISLSGGPEYAIASQSLPRGETRTWTPVGTASLGWQGLRTSFAASYSRAFSDVGGLLGAFNTSNASATGQWQMSHVLSMGARGSYGIQKDASSSITSSLPGGGHTVSGGASLNRQIGEHLSLVFDYTRLHQSYSSIAAISSAPDIDRATASVVYQFTRPLGR